MAICIWRRCPSGRLTAGDLIRDAVDTTSHLVAAAFWEYQAPAPPTGRKVIPGISPPYESTPV